MPLSSTRVNPIEVVDTQAASGGLIALIPLNGGTASVSFTLGGVNVGDFADVSLSVASSGIVATAAVQQAGTVLVTYVNPTNGNLALGAHNIYFKVRQRTAV